MGANGSFALGLTNSEAGRNWHTIGVVGEVKVIKKKNPKDSNKLPEESHGGIRIYAIFEKDGSDVKAIAKYGADGLKLWEIHTTDHDKLGEHYHPWKNGRPVQCLGSKGKPRNVAFPLTDEMKTILEKLRKYEN